MPAAHGEILGLHGHERGQARKTEPVLRRDEVGGPWPTARRVAGFVARCHAPAQGIGTHGYYVVVNSIGTVREPLQAAIVDLDGTMVDTLGDFAVALNRMLAELGLPGIERAAIARLVGKGSEHLLRSVLAQVGGDPGLYEQAWRSYQQHYRSINGQYASVFPGVIEGLKILRGAGLPLACLTNKPTTFAQSLLAAKDLSGFFQVVFGGDAFERRKPDPLPLLKACEALGSSPPRTLMIGDSSNDAAAGRGAGCPVLLVTYGYNHGEPVRTVQADGFLDSMAELGGWLAAGSAR